MRVLTLDSDVSGLDREEHRPEHIINFPALICSPTVSEPSQLENREFCSTRKPRRLARKALIPISRHLSLARQAIFFGRKALQHRGTGRRSLPATLLASRARPNNSARKPQSLTPLAFYLFAQGSKLREQAQKLCPQACTTRPPEKNRFAR